MVAQAIKDIGILVLIGAVVCLIGEARYAVTISFAAAGFALFAAAAVTRRKSR